MIDFLMKSNLLMSECHKIIGDKDGFSSLWITSFFSESIDLKNSNIINDVNGHQSKQTALLKELMKLFCLLIIQIMNILFIFMQYITMIAKRVHSFFAKLLFPRFLKFI